MPTELKGELKLELTPREAEVKALLLKGWACKTIATRLQLASHTVRNVTHQVYLKEGVHSQIQLVLKHKDLLFSSKTQ